MSDRIVTPGYVPDMDLAALIVNAAVVASAFSPVLALIAVLGGWALADIPEGRATRVAFLVIAAMSAMPAWRAISTIRTSFSAAWL